MYKRCDRCRGKGIIDDLYECAMCKGDGTIYHTPMVRPTMRPKNKRAKRIARNTNALGATKRTTENLP